MVLHALPVSWSSIPDSWSVSPFQSFPCQTPFTAIPRFFTFTSHLKAYTLAVLPFQTPLPFILYKAAYFTVFPFIKFNFWWCICLMGFFKVIALCQERRWERTEGQKKKISSKAAEARRTSTRTASSADTDWWPFGWRFYYYFLRSHLRADIHFSSGKYFFFFTFYLFIFYFLHFSYKSILVKLWKLCDECTYDRQDTVNNRRESEN